MQVMRAETSRGPQSMLNARDRSTRLQIPNTFLEHKGRRVASLPHGVLQEALGDLFEEVVGLVGGGLEAVDDGLHRLE
eukprot:9468484-Pyramimonas_sp.AAC.1